ncbi:MAG: LysR family transcriptional regulator ArgP [Nocardioides sp.]|nr:LysR family transcriptional regulator ArgP [Nocardioides sp.]
MDLQQLDTLLAIMEEGTFDAAARRLHLTPSAVSQRVRALERAAGQVLVKRTTPCTVTPAGEPLLRLARQVRLMLAEAAADLPVGDPDVRSSTGVVDLPVAVNADSLGYWLHPVLDDVAGWPRVALRLYVDDESHSHDLLRSGEVLAAVTSEPRPVQGCSVEPLGAARYTPCAVPWLIERHRKGRGVDWEAMPMVTFNEKDTLQDRTLEAHGARRPVIVHRVPSTQDFHEAVRRGLGWGMLLEEQMRRDLGSGTTVRIPGGRPVDVPLFWQRWRLDSPLLDRLTESVRTAAAAELRHPRG